VKPKKSIVFIAFNGEEDGLLGSRYYAADPVFPLRNSVMINLDMVGSKAIIPLSVAAGPSHVPDLKREFLEMTKALGIDAIEGNITASDHFSLGEKDVPTVMLSHMDDKSGYHSPNDTLEDIDSQRLRQVIELVLHYIDKKAY
jgi:Zn-dependent M28 family amino/carboxypeptidase